MEELANINKISSEYFFVDQGEMGQKNVPGGRWRRRMPILIAIIGLFLMAIGIYVNRTKQHQNISESSNDIPGSLVSGSEFSRKLIMVDIGGAVERPGIIKTHNDSRIQDVLIAAGGLSAKADRMYISKNINLAQRVFDGMKLYFPIEGEVLGRATDVVKSSAGNMGSSGSSILSNSLVDLININVASEAELDKLPGVGPVTAKKIVAGRPYQNISELFSRKILGKALFEKIKDLVSTN